MSVEEEISHRHAFLAGERKAAIGRAVSALRLDLAGKGMLAGSGAIFAKERLAAEQIEAGVAELLDATTKARIQGLGENALRAPLETAAYNLVDEVRRALDEPDNNAFGQVYKARLEELDRLAARAKSLVRQYWAGYHGPQPSLLETVASVKRRAEEGDSFLETYDGLTAEVMSASYQSFSLALTQWFAAMEAESQISALLGRVESAIAFDEWFAGAQAPGGMVGSGTIAWPTDPLQILAARLGLIRTFASDFDSVVNFTLNFMYAGGEFDGMATKVAGQVFQPAARDLRRRIAQELSKPAPPSAAAQSAPAADRVVTVDHNQPAFAEMIAAIERVETAVRQTNDYDDVDEKLQRLSELAAGRGLLQSPRVRIAAITTVLGFALAALAAKFETVALGVLSSMAWEGIKAFLHLS